jgi:hypothetical protein
MSFFYRLIGCDCKLQIFLTTLKQLSRQIFWWAGLVDLLGNPPCTDGTLCA